MSMRYQAGIVLPGYNALKVANAPTIGTASVASGTSVSVAFTAPSCVGGGAISSYTAFACCGVKLASGASSPLTVTGLTTGTAYTFKVIATNAYGPSYPSAASNSVTPLTIGQDAYTTAGCYTWVAPAGVTSVSVVAVGPGGPNNGSGGGGGGGGLGWKNNITVTPGNSYSVKVGTAQTTQSSYFCNACLVSGSGGNAGAGGAYVGDGGGTGGSNYGSGNWGGGGGAGGYTGAGGKGGQGQSANAGSAGAGGGGGGGGGACFFAPGGGGGGVGILGQGANGGGGARGQVYCNYPIITGVSFGGGGGSGGGSGSGGSTVINYCTGQWSNGVSAGGLYGGGAGSNTCHGSSSAARGAVRIIYPGTTRSFPSTNTGNL